MEPTNVTSNERKFTNATCADDTSMSEGNGRGAPVIRDMIGKYNTKLYAVIFLLGVSNTLIFGLIITLFVKKTLHKIIAYEVSLELKIK
jgi:hypothetical protein